MECGVACCTAQHTAIATLALVVLSVGGHIAKKRYINQARNDMQATLTWV